MPHIPHVHSITVTNNKQQTTDSYGSCDCSSDPCHLMTSIRWSRRSIHVTWTTATHCSSASPTIWWAGCSMDFKMATLVYTCHCPAWLQLTWPPTVSWSPMKVVVSWFWWLKHVSSDGPTAAMECLAAGGPKLWKSSSSSLRQTGINFEQFKWLLKTVLFGCWDRGALWLTVNCTS